MYEQTNDQTAKYYVYVYLRANTSANGPSGNPYYIGKGAGKRAYGLHGVHLPKDRSRIIFVAENMNEASAFQLEMLLIHLYGRKDLGTGILRNLTDGGEGASGSVRSDETRKKMSLFMMGKKYSLGKKRSNETKAKLSLANTGKKLSSEHIEKMRLARTGKMTGDKSYWFGKKLSPETKKKISLALTGKMTGDKSPHFGKKRSDETRKKLSLANIGKKRSPESIEKTRLANTGRKHSPETKARMSEAATILWAERKAA